MDLVTALIENVRDGIALGASFPTRHLSKVLGRKYHTANVKRCGEVVFRPNDTDAQVFIDIFRHRTYDLSRLKQYDRLSAAYKRILAANQTPVIIDAGANIGVASLWFHAAFPDARIIAIEPDPENIAILRLNTRDRTSIEVVEAAVGSESGRARLFNPTREAWSPQTERDSDGVVEILSINEILARRDEANALFLVKVDIEGFETDLFKTNLEWLDHAEVVIVEPHDWWLPGAGTSKNFVRAMLDRPFEFVIAGENLIYLRV